jgi:hypothetical protein
MGDRPSMYKLNSQPLIKPMTIPPKNMPKDMKITESFEENTCSKALVC